MILCENSINFNMYISYYFKRTARPMLRFTFGTYFAGSKALYICQPNAVWHAVPCLYTREFGRYRRFNGYYCDGIVISTNTSYGYILPIDHYHVRQPHISTQHWWNACNWYTACLQHVHEMQLTCSCSAVGDLRIYAPYQSEWCSVVIKCATYSYSHLCVK